jgi:hypothetical protein
MNFELVRKKYTQFKLFQPRASRDELWAFIFFLNKKGETCYISKKKECTVTGDDASCPA